MGPKQLLVSAAALLGNLLFWPSGSALAEESPARTIQRVEDPEGRRASGDGVYGRFDGDLSFRVGLGGEASFAGPSLRPLLLANLSLYQTLGFYTAFRKGITQVDPRLSVVSVGGSLSPLFLLRWRSNAANGSPFWDMTLDSIALTLGAHLDHPRGGSFGEVAGFEGGVELGTPLGSEAGGLWLRARANWLAGGEGSDATAWLYLAWEEFFFAGLLPVD
jgi:hypothetical protein